MLAKAPYAPTISYTLKSGVPNAIAGTLGMLELTPKFRAKLATGLGPTLSISWALIVFFEFAKALLKVLIPPYLSLELVGHHGSGFPYL